MNIHEIKEFLKSIRNTDIEEILYEGVGNSLYFKKANVKTLISEKKEIIEIKKKEKEKKSSHVVIKSTMVGTFANAQSNDRPPFVREGDNIVVGQKIGQIEAMKIIKDIHSNINGKILKIMISNGESIEYGQELFLVDTRNLIKK
jgi:acetyl-CoA carboxylase biotin carboxyl carrier protein